MQVEERARERAFWLFRQRKLKVFVRQRNNTEIIDALCCPLRASISTFIAPCLIMRRTMLPPSTFIAPCLELVIILNTHFDLFCVGGVLPMGPPHTIACPHQVHRLGHQLRITTKTRQGGNLGFAVKILILQKQRTATSLVPPSGVTLSLPSHTKIHDTQQIA